MQNVRKRRAKGSPARIGFRFLEMRALLRALGLLGRRQEVRQIARSLLLDRRRGAQRLRKPANVGDEARRLFRHVFLLHAGEEVGGVLALGFGDRGANRRLGDAAEEIRRSGREALFAHIEIKGGREPQGVLAFARTAHDLLVHGVDREAGAMGEQLLGRVVIEAQEVVPQIGRLLRKRAFERLVARSMSLAALKSPRPSNAGTSVSCASICRQLAGQ